DRGRCHHEGVRDRRLDSVRGRVRTVSVSTESRVPSTQHRSSDACWSRPNADRTVAGIVATRCRRTPGRRGCELRTEYSALCTQDSTRGRVQQLKELPPTGRKLTGNGTRFAQTASPSSHKDRRRWQSPCPG